MEYNGKLYGKFRNKYFDTGKTSKDYDLLEKQNKKMLEMLEIILQSENTPIIHRKKAKQLIKEATEL